jgi:GT2 family glycosyltransferase
MKTSRPEIDLSISIVNYNLTDSVINLIKSIQRSISDLDYEILVVDNASNDGPEQLMTLGPKVDVVYFNQNVYFTKADNVNINRARGKYVLIINPDTVVESGSIKNLITAIESDKKNGVVVPRFEFPNGDRQASGTLFPRTIDLLFESVGINKNSDSAFEISESDRLIEIKIRNRHFIPYGACLLVRKQMVQEIGIKDDRLIQNYDEYDWCRRIGKSEWKIQIAPNALIIHDRSLARRNASKQQKSKSLLDKIAVNDYYYLIRKHHGLTIFIALKIIWAIRSAFSKVVRRP